MKIAMIISSLAHTGPGIVARDLCKEFITLGHQCKIFYFDDIFGLDLPCPAIKITKGNEIFAEEWDIIHSHGFRPDQFLFKNIHNINNYRTILVTTLHQPIIFKDLHQTFSMPKALIGSILWHKYLKVFDHIVVLNENTRQTLPSKIQERSTVIYNGRSVNLNPIVESDKQFLTNLSKKYKIIGTSSSITKRKGLEQIVKALPSLPNFAFVAIGDGDQRLKLERLAKELKIESRCFFLGYRSNATDYLPFFDLFVMCTRSEGFPLALIEAASQGIPTILSDIPILKAIVSTEMVDFYHLDDIQSLINTIDNNKKSKGIELKKFYETYLTARSMADRYMKLYLKSNKLENS